MENLPKLTEQQQKFVLNYVINGNNTTNAYKSTYDCTKMKDETINVEASKMLKHPKVSLWIKQANANVQEVFEDEIKYSAKDCFEELERIRNKTEDSSKTVNTALKAVELKGKLAGHFIDKHQVTGGNLADVLNQLK